MERENRLYCIKKSPADYAILPAKQGALQQGRGAAGALRSRLQVSNLHQIPRVQESCTELEGGLRPSDIPHS